MVPIMAMTRMIPASGRDHHDKTRPGAVGVVETTDEAVLAHHAARGDFSRWVLDVFSDPHLAAQLRKTESRWSRGEITDLRRAIAQLVMARYAMGD